MNANEMKTLREGERVIWRDDEGDWGNVLAVDPHHGVTIQWNNTPGALTLAPQHCTDVSRATTPSA
jgi:hypothetical protein